MKEKIINNKRKYRLETNPLDLNLIKVQMSLGKWAMRKLPDVGAFDVKVEKIDTKDPDLLISDVEIVCCPNDTDLNLRNLYIKVWNKIRSQDYSELLISGNSQSIKKFLHSSFDSLVNGHCFFSLCKGLIYWINYLEEERIKPFRGYRIFAIIWKLHMQSY